MTVAAGLDADEVMRDYRVAYRSRQVSQLARGEVMLGRAMFGIFGDGKEVAQVALARALKPGDIRSGYYRDQTLMFALGLLTVQQFFAQLYAHVDVEADPSSAGRGMNAHFGTRFLDEAIFAGQFVALQHQVGVDPADVGLAETLVSARLGDDLEVADVVDDWPGVIEMVCSLDAVVH